MKVEKKNAPELSGEQENWKQFEREERIAWWKEVGRNAFVAFVAALTMRLLMAWFGTR